MYEIISCIDYSARRSNRDLRAHLKNTIHSLTYNGNFPLDRTPKTKVLAKVLYSFAIKAQNNSILEIEFKVSLSDLYTESSINQSFGAV